MNHTVVSRSLSLAMLAGIPGCAYHQQFQNAEANKPHAEVTAAPATGWRDRGPLVTHINSQPTGFWRVRERFLISPGKTSLLVVADQEPYDFAAIHFIAEAGHHYHLTYSRDRSSVMLHDISGEPPKLTAKASRL